MLGPFSCAQSLNPPGHSKCNLLLALQSSSWNIHCPTRQGKGEADVGHSSAHTAQLSAPVGLELLKEDTTH